jgi:thiamine pyridinylase
MFSLRAVEPVKLKVALYPYVPDRYVVFALLAREFQARKENEGVTLELVEPGDEYYSGGLLKLDADIYEIDSILLSDMLQKIAPLSASLSSFSPEGIEAVTRNGIVYAMPHWLCGNFLFYRKGDAEIRDAVTWDQLIDVLKKRKKPVMADFFGHLTLGEWYFTMLADRIGVDAAQSAVLAGTQPDPQVVSDLNMILSGCPTGFCRSKDLHNRTGYYARAFVRNQTAAYMGYSETLHYGLQEIIDDCRDDSGCLSPDDIAVRRLPQLTKDGPPGGIGWVDGLAISNKADGPTKAAALRFIDFATSEARLQARAYEWLDGSSPLFAAGPPGHRDCTRAALSGLLYRTRGS